MLSPINISIIFSQQLRYYGGKHTWTLDRCSDRGLGPHGHVPDHGVYAVDVWLQKPLHVDQSSY